MRRKCVPGQEPHSSSQSAPYLAHKVRIGMAILRLVGGACALLSSVVKDDRPNQMSRPGRVGYY